MLSLKLCDCCWKEYSDIRVQRYPNSQTVVCPTRLMIGDEPRSVYGDPPKGCPYFLEHYIEMHGRKLPIVQW